MRQLRFLFSVNLHEDGKRIGKRPFVSSVFWTAGMHNFWDTCKDKRIVFAFWVVLFKIDGERQRTRVLSLVFVGWFGDKVEGGCNT